MLGLDRLYKFIFGKPITIITDAQTVKKIFKETSCGPAVAAARMQRWGVKLSGFQYKIVHRSSNKLAVADALSRLPADNEFHEENEVNEFVGMINIVEELPTSLEEITLETGKDKILAKVINLCQNGTKYLKQKVTDPEIVKYSRLYKDLSLNNGAIFYRERIIIPQTLRTKLLSFLHANHDGMDIMKRSARQKIFWSGIDKDIEQWVRTLN